MNRETVSIANYYFNTGILGGYETAELQDYSIADEEIACFDDTEIIAKPDGLCLERTMMVSGKWFKVESVFGSGGKDAPTAKLMIVIDSEINSS